MFFNVHAKTRRPGYRGDMWLPPHPSGCLLKCQTQTKRDPALAHAVNAGLFPAMRAPSL